MQGIHSSYNVIILFVQPTTDRRKGYYNRPTCLQTATDPKKTKVERDSSHENILLCQDVYNESHTHTLYIYRITRIIYHSNVRNLLYCFTRV
jgi:hypothetical protein